MEHMELPNTLIFKYLAQHPVYTQRAPPFNGARVLSDLLNVARSLDLLRDPAYNRVIACPPGNKNRGEYNAWVQKTLDKLCADVAASPAELMLLEEVKLVVGSKAAVHIEALYACKGSIEEAVKAPRRLSVPAITGKSESSCVMRRVHDFSADREPFA